MASPSAVRRQRKLRVCTSGAFGVGKTSLLVRFCADRFHDDAGDAEAEFPTSGDEELLRDVELRGEQFTLRLKDTAGSEQYSKVTASYFREADIVLFCFDLCDRQSLVELDNNVREMVRVRSEDCISAVVGCKSDAVDAHEVKEEQARQFADENRLPYFATSARTGDGIRELFDAVLTANERSASENFKRRGDLVTADSNCSSLGAADSAHSSGDGSGGGSGGGGGGSGGGGGGGGGGRRTGSTAKRQMPKGVSTKPIAAASRNADANADADADALDGGKRKAKCTLV